MSIDLEEQYDKIYRYCYAKVKHQQIAEDITQETFLRFFENHTYKELGKRLPYLYTIARNKCIDHYRKKESLPLKEDISEPSKEETILLHVAVEEALMQLDEAEQELVFLKYVNELTVNEISKSLSISRFSVYRKLKQCLKKLEAAMERREFFE